MWWKMREALDPAYGAGLMLPPDRELKADLCAPRWKLTNAGIQVEGKSTHTRDGFGDLKKRLGRSPDKGDSCVYALLEGRKKSGVSFSAPPRSNSQYNPHRWR